MNAHVSFDLPYVVSDVFLVPPEAVDPDYDLVNHLIENLSSGLLREVTERFDPTVATAELPLVLGGASSFGAFVTLWRSESWVLGNELLSNSDRTGTEQRIEFNATTRALAILPETSYLPFIESSADRDAFCKAHR
jgi:hypothetical protein